MRKLVFITVLFYFNLNLVFAQKVDIVTKALDLPESFQNVRDFTLSSNTKEAYISVQSSYSEVSVIARIDKIDNKWTTPKLLPFSGRFNDLEPFLSPDNLKLYFASNRPLQDSLSQPKDFDIWYVERNDVSAEWGSPINLGSPVNTEYDEFYPSVAKNKNLYFTCKKPNSIGEDDIFKSIWNGQNYLEPETLSESINTNSYEFNAFIAPDESYLVFSGYNRADGVGSADLYISFHKENSWSKAENLGVEINSKQMEYCPFIDVQSMTLYFTSKRKQFEKTYSFNTIEDVLKEINKDQNGQSRIYKVPFKKIITLKKTKATW